MRKSWVILTIVVCLIFVLILLALNFKTGFFHPEKIDEADLKIWNYSEGIIVGAEEKRMIGSNETCWLMVHGYASTPKDLSFLGEKINDNFNDTVIIPRLKGHGELPSKMLQLSFPDWYDQIENEFLQLDKTCGQVNLAGFSFGGAIALKIAEKYKVNNIYLISPFLKIRHKAYYIFPKENYISLIAERAIYSVKFEPAQINDPEGVKEYIGYYSFPLIPVKNSFDDLIKVKDSLHMINASGLLILHSRNDDTIDIESSKIINNSVLIENKEFVMYEKSNHVLLADYDKEDAIWRILFFERKSRNES